MNGSLSDFLVENGSTLTFVVLFASLVVFAMIEGYRPLRSQSRAQLRSRWPTNFGFMLVGQVNLSWVVPATAVATAWWADRADIGILRHMELPLWVATLVTCLVLELVSYAYHRLLHRVPWLWRIHAVHHCDTELDFTTTFRNHPLELLLVLPVIAPLVAIIGFPVAAVVIYQAIRSLVLVFAHSNLRLPERFEALLRLFVNTPHFHRVHHSSDRRYTDSNFCPTFPVWDYLFGTARNLPRRQLETMEIGLEYFRDPERTRLLDLLLIPFTWSRHKPSPNASTGETT